MFQLLLSAFTVLLSKLSGQEDIVVGTPVSGRQHADLEEMVGIFINTLPLRNQLSRQQSFRSYLQQVRQGSIAAFENQSFPYEALIDELDVDRDTGRNPLFDVLFAYDHQDAAPSEDGLAAEAFDNGWSISKFDLSLSATEVEGRLLLNFEYASDLFEAATIERFARYFRRIITSIIAATDQPIGEIELLGASERAQLLQTFNDTAADYPRDRNLIELFEAQVAQQPDAVALIMGQSTLSYSALDARANRMARLLQSKGASSGEVIGLMGEKSIDLFIGMLGILKAGCTYLPLDVDQPKQRSLELLQQTEA